MDAGGALRRRTCRDALNFVAGAFCFQPGRSTPIPSFKQEQGSAAARFLLAPTPAAATPGLLDGYGFNQFLPYDNTSAARLRPARVVVTDRLRVLPGLRLNYDKKDVDFDQQVYGGLQTTDPALIALQLSVLAPQAYTADVDDTNLSGQMTVAYKVAPQRQHLRDLRDQLQVGRAQPERRADRRARPAGAVGRDGQAGGRATTSRSASRPSRSAASPRTSAVFDTEIKDFQAQVVNASVGVLRGYLANAEKVRVRGVEFDGSARFGEHVSFYASAAYTDGKYVSFPDAPPPLEETGGPQVKDISGSDLPGHLEVGGLVRRRVRRRTATVLRPPGRVLRRVRRQLSLVVLVERERVEVSRRRRLLAAQHARRVPRRRTAGRCRSGRATCSTRTTSTCSRPQPGNTGLYVGQPGDPRTFGVTLRLTFKSR